MSLNVILRQDDTDNNLPLGNLYWPDDSSQFTKHHAANILFIS